MHSPFWACQIPAYADYLLILWAVCRLQVPQDLQREMQSQQAACDTIIASKDAIVAAMRAQLHQKDDEYVRMLKQQGEDVDLLLLNMGKHLEEMQTAYRDELAQIDGAYMQVTQHLLRVNAISGMQATTPAWCRCNQ